MHKFYVIFKNQDSIEGTTTMSSEEFSRKIIQPNIDDIYTFQFWDEEDENSDFDLVDNTVPYEDQVDEYWPDGEDIQQEPINIDYVVVSTSFMYREIMVFPGNENGNVTDWGQLAESRGTTSTDHNTAMRTFGMFDDYEFVKVVHKDRYIHQTLWKKK